MKTTRLFYYLLVALLYASFNSCSDDDDDNGSIVGTWYYSGNVTPTLDVVTNNPKFTEALKKFMENGFRDNYTLTFNNDASGFFDYGDNDIEIFTYTYKNNVLEITTYNEYYVSYPWSANAYIKKNTLILEQDIKNEFGKSLIQDIITFYGLGNLDPESIIISKLIFQISLNRIKQTEL